MPKVKYVLDLELQVDLSGILVLPISSSLSSVSGKNIRIFLRSHTLKNSPEVWFFTSFLFNYNFGTYSPHVPTNTDYGYYNRVYIIRMY